MSQISDSEKDTMFLTMSNLFLHKCVKLSDSRISQIVATCEGLKKQI